MRVLKGCLVLVFLLCVFIAYYFQQEMQNIQEEDYQKIMDGTENAPVDQSYQNPDGTQKDQVKPLKIVPPVIDGTMDEMWSGFKDGEQIFLPAFGIESLNQALKEKGYGNVKAQDFKPKYLYVEQEQNGKTYIFLTCFTDSSLIKPGFTFMTINPDTLLEQALYDSNCDGLYFNPKCRVCDEAKYARGISKYGIAEVLGYLKAKPDSGRLTYHALANDAMMKKEWYQVLYYWAMSRREGREGDDWKKAEMAKIRAWIELDFPGAKDYAKGELEWYIKTYGANPEAEALLKLLAAPQAKDKQ
ncbi:MAG: hypothetical protein JXR97_01060 [Planctomycetes bacterium]|nr:hypothetical protein [Planctomycetota bacterium]